jgi:hypothetical protein
MKKTEPNNYAGQRFHMYFKYRVNGDHFVVNIAHIEPVDGLEWQTGDPVMDTILVKEILETRDRPMTGANHFNPLARFYTVKAIKV